MTQLFGTGAEERGLLCRWCRRPLPQRRGPGRPREYCKPSCRQQDYVARRRAREVGLSDAELIVARAQLAELADKLYELEAAIEDVERDLADARTAEDLSEALAWLLQAARPLAQHRFG